MARGVASLRSVLAVNLEALLQELLILIVRTQTNSGGGEVPIVPRVVALKLHRISS